MQFASAPRQRCNVSWVNAWCVDTGYALSCDTRRGDAWWGNLLNYGLLVPNIPGIDLVKLCHLSNKTSYPLLWTFSDWFYSFSEFRMRSNCLSEYEWLVCPTYSSMTPSGVASLALMKMEATLALAADDIPCFMIFERKKGGRVMSRVFPSCCRDKSGHPYGFVLQLRRGRIHRCWCAESYPIHGIVLQHPYAWLVSSITEPWLPMLLMCPSSGRNWECRERQSL
jgi:hypothetical protein